jgi:SAM-dependent methyltransferase
MEKKLPEFLVENFLDMADDSCIAILPHALRMIAVLGIADQLMNQEMHVDDIASAARLDSPNLYRLLRALATVGVVEESEPRVFSLSQLGQRLCSDARMSSRWLVENSESTLAWLHADQMLASEGAGSDGVLGQSFFSHIDSHPEARESFMARMRERARNCYRDFADALDWSDVRTVMDIGGNDGSVLECLLQAYRHLKGILFDRETVINSVLASGGLSGVSDRCRLIGGDFFKQIPDCADVHLMCSVLHDWPDESAAIILRNSGQALPPGGRLIIVDMLIPENAEWHPSKWSDIGMMVLTGGRERTLWEFDCLLADCGFTLSGVKKIPNSHFSLLEAVVTS